MAKLSKIHRNLQREEVVERYAKRRAELKTIVKSETATDEQKAAAVAELQKQFPARGADYKQAMLLL